jgi:hypothetical protein
MRKLSVLAVTALSSVVLVACGSSSKSSSSAATAAPASTSFVMPNEVGKDLQAAQDDIQRVSGNPLFITHSHDATGQERHQILDRNWTVCSQNVAPGTQVQDTTNITFNVVKLDESCP